VANSTRGRGRRFLKLSRNRSGTRAATAVRLPPGRGGEEVIIKGLKRGISEVKQAVALAVAAGGGFSSARWAAGAVERRQKWIAEGRECRDWHSVL
jgi:hypothetical protein